MDLIYFVLSAYGLTQLLICSTLLDKIRPSKKDFLGYGELFHCPMCMGFWSGMFLWGINKYTELFTFEYSLANAFLLGWLSSGTSYVLCSIFGDDGVKYEYVFLDKKMESSTSKTVL